MEIINTSIYLLSKKCIQSHYGIQNFTKGQIFLKVTFSALITYLAVFFSTSTRKYR